MEGVVLASVIGFGVVSIVAQSPGAADRTGLGPEALIAGWVVVFAALAGLAAYDRHRAGQPATRPAPAATRETPRALGERSSSKAPAAASPDAASKPRAKTTPAAGAKAPAPPPPTATRSAPAPRRPPAPSREHARTGPGPQGRAEGSAPGPALVELSRAQLASGQTDRAVDTARQALLVSRNRDSVAQLIRVLTETRRFDPADGPMLRRATARHPGQAMLRHALGVYEAMHGDLRAARDHLMAAARLEADTEAQRAIQRDLDRTRQAIARGASSAA